MQCVKRSYRRNIFAVACAAMALSMVTAGPAFGAVSDYYGTYAGTYSATYSGNDYGYWVAVISADSKAFLSYSTLLGSGDGGSIYYSGESGSTGEFYSTSVIQGASIDPIYVTAGGSVSGQWNNSYYGESGTFTGSKVTDSSYAGSYSGTLGGDATGTWQMTVESNGYITGTVTVEGGTASFEGGVHPEGYFAAIGTIDYEDFAVFGTISGSSVSGGWVSDDGSEGTISTGSGGGDGGGGGGGCFIFSIKGK